MTPAEAAGWTFVASCAAVLLFVMVSEVIAKAIAARKRRDADEQRARFPAVRGTGR